MPDFKVFFQRCKHIPCSLTCPISSSKSSKSSSQYLDKSRFLSSAMFLRMFVKPFLPKGTDLCVLHSISKHFHLHGLHNASGFGPIPSWKAEDWHRIVAVNDVTGDAKGMAQELCRHKVSAVSFAGNQQAKKAEKYHILLVRL